MTSRQPPLSSPNLRGEPLDDPFSDRPRQTHFNDTDTLSLGASSHTQPYESTLSFQNEGAYEAHADDDYVEKLPLNVGQNFTGGFYPPP